MRRLWLLLLPAGIAAACVESTTPPYTLDSGGNLGPQGGPRCHPVNGIGPFSQVNGVCVEADGGDQIVIAPVSIPVDGDGGVTAVITDAGITIPASDAPADFAYVWVANTGNGTVSKIDVKQLKEVGRYQSTRVCSNTSGETPFDDPSVCVPFNSATQYPSRTTIDGNKDAWVANRAFGAQATVSKIASDVSRCVERNGIPGIQTTNNNIPVAEDECVLFTVPVGGTKNNAIARAIAVGPEDNDSGTAGSVWVGLWADQKALKLRNSDGKLLASYALNVNTYGAAIDRVQADGSYHVWFVGNGPNAVQFVQGGKDTCTGPDCVSAKFTTPNVNCFDYGVAVDARGRVYVQSSSCSGGPNGSQYPRTWQLTPSSDYTTGTWRFASIPGINQGRGVAVQVVKEQIDATHIKEHSKMWVTNYDQWAWSAWQKSFASSFDGDKLACDADLDGVTDDSCDYNADGVVDWKDYDAVSYWVPGLSPIGIGIDPLDSRYIWTANQNASVSRIDSLSGTFTTDDGNVVTSASTQAWVPDANIDTVPVGPAPYTYSDFTGSARAQITARHGMARLVYAGGCADGLNATWSQLDWTSVLPADTHIEFWVRSADADYNNDGRIDANDAAVAPAQGPYTEYPALPDPPGLHNDSPVNLVTVPVAQSPYLEVDMDLYSSAQESPIITSVNIHRSCN